MADEFLGLPAVAQALVAGLGTWAATAVGAAAVVLFHSVSDRLLAVMLGLAAGIMLAASFWSLLAPSIELAEAQGMPGWAPAIVGFLLGAALIRALDLVLPHWHARRDLMEGPTTSWRRATLLTAAITLHNVPEGLAVGVAFGAASLTGDLAISGATVGSAVALTVGIAIQNVPEGVAVAVPLRAEGFTQRRSFFIGQISGAVEPLAAVVGAYAVILVRPALPYALAFAAGAMIFVVVEELIPESQAETRFHDGATMAAIGGFGLMMILDVALG